MYPKEYRLKKKRDIEIVFENGRFSAGALCTAKVWKINPEKFPKRGYVSTELKFAVVVGKKIHRSAVQRNRLKRQIREVIRLLLKEDLFKVGFYVTIMAKRQMFEQPFTEIQKDIQRILKKARVLQ